MVAGSVRRIYNQSAYWRERVAMAQWRFSYLDELGDGGNVPRQQEKIERWGKTTTPASFGELSYVFSRRTKMKHEGNWTTLSARERNISGGNLLFIRGLSRSSSRFRHRLWRRPSWLRFSRKRLVTSFTARPCYPCSFRYAPCGNGAAFNIGAAGSGRRAKHSICTPATSRQRRLNIGSAARWEG